MMGAGVLIVTFIVGGMGGAAVTRFLDARQPDAKPEAADECDGREHRGSPYDGLGLSADQQLRVDAVLERRKTQMDEVWQHQRPVLDSIVTQTREEIRTILTQDQRDEMDRRREARKERAKRCEARAAAAAGKEK
jgi:hypothetical protein